MAKRLFVFDLDCELAIANGSKYYMPPANIIQMINDLSFLLAWLADKADFILVNKKIEADFENVCRYLGVECQAILPEDIPRADIECGEPWGWSPRICHVLAQWGLSKEWEPEQKVWYSRKTAQSGLKRLSSMLPFIESGIIPQVCATLPEIEAGISDGEYIAKAPWSSSGKGLLSLNGRLTAKEKEWLSGVLRKQGFVMLEKRLSKVFDFAMEFHSGEKEIEFIGWSSFVTGQNGEYRGNYIGAQENIENKLATWLCPEELSRLKHELPGVLKDLLPFYQGYLGVDMMIYTDKTGKYRIQPCVEINLRYNMGIVAFFLSRNYLAPGTQGQFTIQFYPEQGEALCEHFRLQEKNPVVYKNNRIKSGYLNLTPVNEATYFIASIICD